MAVAATWGDPTVVAQALTRSSSLGQLDRLLICFRVGYRVCSVEMSPTDDTFLSGSTDDTVRFWDLRAQKAQVSKHLLPRLHVPWTPPRLTRLIIFSGPTQHCRPTMRGV